MDRNEKFRRRLEIKLNQTLHKGSGKFDPTPYVNILMDNVYWEDSDEEELEDSLDAIQTNPDLDFILGRSSLLNPAQKQLVVKELHHRLTAAFEFNAIPPANDLIDMMETTEFEKYQYVDEDGNVEYDFTEFFDKHHFTKEQREMVSDCFFEQIRAKEDNEYNFRKDNTNALEDTKISKTDYIVPILLFLIFVVVPSCFIPNFLQRIGWLAPNAGWFMKIAVGIMSAIAIFYIWRKLINYFAKRILKTENSR